MLAICSLFRDNISLVDKCFELRQAWDYPKDELIHICIEGDSVDGTYEKLLTYESENVIIKKLDLHTRKHGSTINEERMYTLGKSWNHGLETILALDKPITHVLILDSDLITPPDMLSRLLGKNKDVIAPMMYLEGTERFRDTWGYWAGTRNFLPQYPYHKKFKREVFEVDGVGVPFIKMEVLRRGARFTETEEVVGFCKYIKTLGYRIYVDGTLAIYHPQSY